MEIPPVEILGAISGSFAILPREKSKKLWKCYFSKCFHCKEIKLSANKHWRDSWHSFAKLNPLKIRSTCARKARTMKKGISSCFVEAGWWTVFFCHVECTCCTTADNVLQAVVVSPGRTLLPKETPLMISACFCAYLFPLVFLLTSTAIFRKNYWAR